MDHPINHKKQINTYLCIFFSVLIISFIIEVKAQSHSEDNESVVNISDKKDTILYNGIVLPDRWPPDKKSDPRVPSLI
jgi:hypothetical protein